MVWRIAMKTGLHTSRITIKAWLLVVIIMVLAFRKTVGLKGQKLTDKDVKRPVTNGEHDKNDFYNLDERVGHIGSKTGKWDNGLYVTAFMKTVPVQFLVDSGSTLTF
jgi:hypothetical protein